MKEIEEILSKSNASILYTPLKNEVDYSATAFPLKIFPDKILIPNNKNSDAFEWAKICISKFRKFNPYVLIPGTQFDIHGTRKGKGGGWYDRFLSKIPKEWVRIGLCHRLQISQNKLERKLWDEPIDYLFIYDKNGWRIITPSLPRSYFRVL